MSSYKYPLDRNCMNVDLKTIVGEAVNDSMQKLRQNFAHDVTAELRAKLTRYPKEF